jgi:mannosyltransferase OCH1-like enzyme
MNKWKVLNPFWTLNIITKNTLALYVTKYELPEYFYEDIETPQACSDIVRTILLYKYGGVWLDSNIILIQPLDWVQEIAITKKISYVGYYMPSFTTNSKCPIIENWFMATTPKNIFLKNIWNELKLGYGKRTQYVNEIIRSGIDVQNIPKSLLSYLWMHVSITKVLKESGFKNFHVIDAYEDAFKLHKMFNWKADKLVDFLMSDTNFNFSNMKLIKLRGEERNVLLKKNTPYGISSVIHKLLN